MGGMGGMDGMDGTRHGRLRGSWDGGPGRRALGAMELYTILYTICFSS
jgi:hypothetical protein